MIGVNAGSGQRRFESGNGWIWVNVDCISRPNQVPDKVCDIAKGRWPFEDSSVDTVVLSQVIEHFHLTEGDSVLREAYRVLKPGGSLIATFPNVRELAKRWLRNEITDYIFSVNVYGAWQGEPGDDHHWQWSSLSLAQHLMTLDPWTRLKAFDWRKIPGMDLANDWWVDSLEAVK